MVVDDLQTLLDSTAEALGVDRATITSASRLATPSLARQIVMALWSEGHSLQESAEAVNRTSHSLANYARQRIFDGMHGQAGVRQKVKATLEIYRQKKARPSQYLGINFFAELHGILSPLNPQTITDNTENA